MKIVIDIPDETFYGTGDHIRVARYLRRVAEDMEAQPHIPPSAGTVCLTPRMPALAHTAGWAVEGAPWQRVDNQTIESV